MISVAIQRYVYITSSIKTQMNMHVLLLFLGNFAKVTSFQKYFRVFMTKTNVTLRKLLILDLKSTFLDKIG